MGTRRHLKGFTLVEMLIAVTILGMVIGVATFGFSLFSRHWGGRLAAFDQAQAEFQRLDLVLRALRDTLPYVVRDAEGAPGFYFLGREEGLTLVSAAPVFSPGQIAVVRVFREPAGEGRWNLVYEEAPLGTARLQRAGQTLPFAHRLVVARGLPRLQFTYFGWASPQQRSDALEGLEGSGSARWYPEYDGLLRRLHPQRIGIDFGGPAPAVVDVPTRADDSMRRFSDDA